MAIFTAWAKIYSSKYFCNAKVGRWVGQNFCPVKLFRRTVLLLHLNEQWWVIYVSYNVPASQSDNVFIFKGWEMTGQERKWAKIDIFEVLFQLSLDVTFYFPCFCGQGIHNSLLSYTFMALLLNRLKEISPHDVVD